MAERALIHNNTNQNRERGIVTKQTPGTYGAGCDCSQSKSARHNISRRIVKLTFCHPDTTSRATRRFPTRN